MPKTPLAKIPYPSGSDAPAAAADMMAAFMSLDDRLVLAAVDEADRNARYADAPVSSLVVSGQSQKIWLKTGPSALDWLLIFGDTGWVTTGFVVQDGWSVTSIKARKRGVDIDVRGEFVRTGDDIEAGPTGNIADTAIVSLPPQFRPEPGSLDVLGIARSQYSSGAIQAYNSGAIRLLDLHAGASIPNGDFLRFSLSFMGE